jgi:hypothetical protein
MAGSSFGFQPHPLPPKDIKEFHSYQRSLIDLHKERLFKPQVRVREVVGTKELSKIYNNERKYRDGNIGK